MRFKDGFEKHETHHIDFADVAYAAYKEVDVNFCWASCDKKEKEKNKRLIILYYIYSIIKNSNK